MLVNSKWIDNLIEGLIYEVGSNDVYDIASHLDINITRDNEKQNPFLRNSNAIYIRNLLNYETIILRDDLFNERFVLAHELGHALLHTEITSALNSPLDNKGKYEVEADYFAIKLLYGELDLNNYIGYTKKQLANELGVSENCIDYLIK